MKKLANLFLVAIAVVLCSYTSQDNGGQVQYTVIHHEGMNVQVFDTIVDVESGYTIEDYITELGLEVSDVDIIHVEDESDFVSSDTEIWLINEEETENGFQHKTIEIKLNDDDVDNMNVNFEDFESEEGAPHMIQKRIMISDADDMEFSDEMVLDMKERTNGSVEMEMEVQVEKIIDENGNEEIQIWVNGEEVDPNTFEEQFGGGGEVEIIILEEGEEIGEGENVFIKEFEGKDGVVIETMDKEVEVQKFIDEEGNEEVLMWINGEEVDPEEYEGELEFGGEGECEFIFIGDGAEMGDHFPVACNFTIGIVSPVSEEVATKTVKATSNVGELSFIPRGNNTYNLTFNSEKLAKTEVYIYDIQGKEVYHNNLGDFEGAYSEDINLGNIQTGTYVLNIVQNGERVVKKIIVQ